MRNHFDQNLNTKALIHQYQPHLVVEAGCGPSTLQLRELQRTQGFRLICIDVLYDPDEKPEDCTMVPGKWTTHQTNGHPIPMELIYGVSYLNFELFDDHSIDMVIVDTDHNGWTLAKELAVLERKMKEGGLILLHDVESFKDCNGKMDQYPSNEIPYPRTEIEEGPTMGQIVETYKQKWPVIAESVEAHGAIAFQVRN